MNCNVCVYRVALRGFEAKAGAPARPHHPDEPGHQHGRHH
jgi:sirohydrochlorin cobaltochelatase